MVSVFNMSCQQKKYLKGNRDRQFKKMYFSFSIIKMGLKSQKIVQKIHTLQLDSQFKSIWLTKKYFCKALLDNQQLQYINMYNAESSSQTNLKNQLYYLNQRLNQLLGYKFQNICLFSKNIAKEFATYIRHTSTIKQNKQLRQIFDQCIQNLEVIIRSTHQFREYFQFPYLAYIFKKIARVVQKTKHFNQTKLNLRIEKNEQSFCQKNINLIPITKREFKFIESDFLNKTFLEIFKNQIRLPNNQCTLCSQVFIKDFEIFNKNPGLPVIVGLTQKEAFNDIQLYKNICAVCNEGGGLIILGAQRTKNSIYSTGINFKDLNQVQKKMQEIIELATSHIRPRQKFYINVFYAMVHNNFVDRQNLYQQKNRYCLKIFIYAPQKVYTSYVELSNKGFHSLFQSYKIQNNNILGLLPERTKNSFYNYMHNKYSRKNTPFRSSHNRINCTCPQTKNSKLFQEYYQSLTPQQKYMLQYSYTGQKKVVQQLDQLKFKYSNNSILAVGSKNKDRFVKDFQDYANTKKLKFQLFKPFKNDFKQGQRSIWMLSHVDKHETIKSILKQTDKEGYITFIPVHKTLQIDSSKINEQYYTHIQKTFNEKYPEGFQVTSKNVTYEGKERQALFFYFNCYPHSIYGYLIFQSLQLKPYFVKDNTEYKKKTSKKW